MYPQILLLLLLGSSSADKIPKNAKHPAKWCSKFDLTGNYTKYIPNEQVHISKGVACSNSNTKLCSVTAGGFWKTTAQTSYSPSVEENNHGSEESEADYQLSWTLYKTIGYQDLYSGYVSFGAFAPQTLSINDTLTDSGNDVGIYAVATNQYRCISGIVNECPSGAAIKSGTKAEVCQPIYTDARYHGFPVYVADVSLVLTNASEAKEMSTNPHEHPPAGLSTSLGASIVLNRIGLCIGTLIAVLSAI